MSQYINEAFKQFNLLEDMEEFSITPDGLDNLKTFMGQAMDDEPVADVIDLEAESEEDLKKSYVGKVICDCNVCHSNIFYNKEDIVIDEDGVVNPDDECPYCMSQEGYTIIGEIKDWSPEVEKEIADTLDPEVEDELAEEPIEIEDEEEQEVVEESLKLDGVEELKGVEGLRKRPDKAGVEAISGVGNSKISGTTLSEGMSGPGLDRFLQLDADDHDILVELIQWLPDKTINDFVDYYAEAPDLNESIEDVTISTEDETMTMTTKEDGGVVVETSPKEETSEEFYDDFDMPEEEVAETDEVIAPVSDETESEIMTDDTEDGLETEEEMPAEENSDEDVPEEDVTVSEFDEETFDELGESYLRRNYNNVSGFKTTQVKVNENLLNIDGIITFKSGNQKKTTFVFESTAVKDNTFLFEGFNQQINAGKKAFKMNCSIQDKKIIPESLKYNYTAKNELQESVKISGTIKAKKRK